MTAATSIRIGAALGRALDRQAIRTWASHHQAVDLVVVTTHASALLDSQVGSLDRLVIDGQAPGAAETIEALSSKRLLRSLLCIHDDPATLATRYGLRAGQVMRRSQTPTDLTAWLGKVIGLGPPVAADDEAPVRTPSSFRRREILLIGCSTGGPEALPVVLGGLPASFTVPIVVVQHMPPKFTALLASQLDSSSPFDVREVDGPVRAKAGEVWLAPGDRHLVVKDTSGRLDLSDDPPENACRPAVDVLFRSAAATYGRRSIAVILTGMGTDGRAGAARLKAEGAYVIAQDEQSSVVWGMPGAVTKAGLADEVRPLDSVAAAVCAQFAPAAGLAR